MITLVTGGARSGKSSFAEKLCMSISQEAIYVATAQAFDDEMKERIALHQLQRIQANYPWRNVEEPFELVKLIGDWHSQSLSSEEGAPTILVDCLTLWLSNVLLSVENDKDRSEKVKEEILLLVNQVRQYPGNLIMVTNEVGDGIVPEYPLGRLYRDLAGFMNQAIARSCSQVFLVTAGIPIELKSREYIL
ncbi:bifunctional adenosylcobinamide kinase/adenosylcobinamide-phosphate guanylyltransferase [Paenibacillus crassostreae]|uniref:Adenosylcobinamide kinase n=1 Tax=Paenibacillus crassostreae TaxID=1763538 RepID=A0A167GID8_9BACL|nr:bifunctional adenosylcobinamide kinase/adenosylcobinamide-phosphate guanylyltransferase [Paenibacillus crassostreae]AOZ92139.1 bifunctional adenosylcobinamide kinase/adenosylcobinamide-phosphate guanylyltransferase [Paenibacillus crassostreae]OAB77600.1 adenosylcobinamide kinase/adenosylcobinamide phosphate guanyltransferase [Paenibacillus crassostreae]